MLTFMKMNTSDGEPTIRVEGFTTSPIYLRVLMVESPSSVENDEGVHRVLKAQAQEVNEDGIAISTPGPAFSSLGAGESIARGNSNVIEHLQNIRRKAIMAFLSQRKLAEENIPTNISDTEGEV